MTAYDPDSSCGITVRLWNVWRDALKREIPISMKIDNEKREYDALQKEQKALYKTLKKQKLDEVEIANNVQFAEATNKANRYRESIKDYKHKLTELQHITREAEEAFAKHMKEMKTGQSHIGDLSTK